MFIRSIPIIQKGKNPTTIECHPQNGFNEFTVSMEEYLLVIESRCRWRWLFETKQTIWEAVSGIQSRVTRFIRNLNLYGGQFLIGEPFSTPMTHLLSNYYGDSPNLKLGKRNELKLNQKVFNTSHWMKKRFVIKYYKVLYLYDKTILSNYYRMDSSVICTKIDNIEDISIFQKQSNFCYNNGIDNFIALCAVYLML